MKSISRIFLILCFPALMLSQSVGIGTQSPDSSALVDMSSTTKGMLVPRMTTAQRDAIVDPAAGLMILNLDDYCMDIFDGTYWSKNCGLRITGIDSLPDEWIPKADLTGVGRYGAVSFVINDKAYLGMGSDGGALSDLWMYNPQTNVWVQKANIPVARSGAVGFSLLDYGYVATGYNENVGYLNDVWKYIPANNQWVAQNNFPGSPRFISTAVSHEDVQKAYLIGGYPWANDVWSYTPAGDYWVNLGNFPKTIYGAVGFLLEGYVCVGSGSQNDNYSGDFYYYDPQSYQWFYLTTMGGTPRTGAVAMVIGNNVYIGTGTNSGTPMSDFWRYNYSTGWHQADSFPGEPRSDAEAFVVNGMGYLATGMYNTGLENDLWAYKPAAPLGYAYAYPLPPQDAHKINNGIWTRDSTDHIYSDQSSSVGIGIESPLAKLHVNGTFKTSGDVLPPFKFSNTNANRKVVLTELAGNDYQFSGLGTSSDELKYNVASSGFSHVFYTGINSTSSAELMRLQGDGDLGIGVNNPQNRLDVLSGSPRTGTHVTGRPLYVTGDINEDSNGIEFRHTNGTQGLGFGFNTLYAAGSNTSQDLGLMAKGVNGNIIMKSNGLERMRITGNGNVGIGNSVPNAPLQFSNALTNRKIVLWEGLNNDHQYYGFGVNGSVLRYQVSNTNDQHVFYAGTSSTNSQELMRIKGNGNVAISGLIENEAYAVPNFLNGFTNYGNGYVAAGYYKDKEGIVRLRGTVYKNSSPNGQGIFVLPAGYRPGSGTVAFSVVNNGTLGVVEVLWDGSVFVQNCAAGWISLDSIVFRAD